MDQSEMYAILLYGFSEESAAKALHYVKESTGKDLFLLSASCREEEVLESILSTPPTSLFEEKSDSFMMFLGFDDTMIRSTLDGYPKTERRPIFCTLTENNLSWTPSYLLEHLIEERSRCEAQQKISS